MPDSLPLELPARLQGDIQKELERREWAEPEDTVMAEYIFVQLSNGIPRDKLQADLEDLVDNDFEPSFLDWLEDHKKKLEQPAPAASAAPAAPAAPATQAASSSSASPLAAQPPSGPAAGSRMFSAAVGGSGSKRKVELIDDEHNKRRLLDTPLGDAPTGPRAWKTQNQNQGRNEGGRPLADRLSGPLGGRGAAPVGPGGLNVRGAANGRGVGMPGMGPGMGPGFRPQFGGQQGQRGPGGPGGFMPGQQEMMMQMMAMQANMAHMAQQMTQMAQEKSAVRPPRPTPYSRIPQGTKLGGHAVSSAPPKATVGPIPDKPTSTGLCKFSVGCTNSRCTYSHPSPAADEKSGMVLSEEPCKAGKGCKDPECVNSHVSPAAVLGASAGPTRVLCKFKNCTNPTCQYRHEDSEGNFIPPPALNNNAASKPAESSPSKSDDEPSFSLDRPLDDSKTPAKACRFGERCTRADCKFAHPSSRPTPRHRQTGRPADDSIGRDMKVSRKFAAPTSAPLNPAAGEFKPSADADKEELGVTM